MIAARQIDFGKKLRGLALAFAVFCARADPVLEWNELMLDAIRADSTGPTLASRNLAILHTAQFDAVNCITRTAQPYRFQWEVPQPASPEGAAIAAGHSIFTALFPAHAAHADALRWSQLAAVSRDEAFDNGMATGLAVATAVLAARASDGAGTQVPYIPQTLPGQWRRTGPFFRPPLDPHWRSVRPFCIPSTPPFTPPPPPPLDSLEYAADFNEVREWGGINSVVRTPYQTETAVFWSDFSYTVTPPGHWFEIAAAISRDRKLVLTENSRLFALLSIAQADAAIVAWEAKYRFNLWRPVTAIGRAGEDGNPLTEADPEWESRLPSPPFPAYTSGHSTFSHVSARILSRYFGTDAITFTVGSDSLPGVFRTYNSLLECALEVGMSRIYGGIHFSFDNVAGKDCGIRIAEFVSAHYLRPDSELPRMEWDPHTEPGRPLIRLHGRPGFVLALESSTDLDRWNQVTNAPAAIGGVLVPMDLMGPHRFYRVREQ